MGKPTITSCWIPLGYHLRNAGRGGLCTHPVLSIVFGLLIIVYTATGEYQEPRWEGIQGDHKCESHAYSRIVSRNHSAIRPYLGTAWCD